MSQGTTGYPAPKAAELCGGTDPNGKIQSLQLDASNNLKVTGALTFSDPAEGTNGALAPTISIQVAGQNPSGNLTPLKLDASGNLLVDISSPIIVSENVAQFGGSNVVTGTGASGVGIPRFTVSSDSSLSVSASALPTGAATSANQTTQITAVQAIQANQTNGTQLTGITGTVPLPTGAATSALQVLAIPDLTGSGSITILNSNLNSGVATVGSTVALAVNGQSAFGIQISGTWTGTLIVQGTTDNTNWVQLSGVSNENTGALANTISSASVGLYQAGCAGFVGIRVTASAAMTGTAVVTVRASIASSNVAIDAPLPAGTNSIGTVVIGSGTITAVTSATVTPTKGTLTDGSGSTSATPSTATTAAAINATRNYLFIQNCSSSATIWINFTTTAVAGQPSIPLLPYAAFVQETGFISTELVSVISTTASAPYVLKQA